MSVGARRVSKRYSIYIGVRLNNFDIMRRVFKESSGYWFDLRDAGLKNWYKVIRHLTKAEIGRIIEAVTIEGRFTWWSEGLLKALNQEFRSGPCMRTYSGPLRGTD